MKCPRCLNGQMGREWGDYVCLQCGCRVEDGEGAAILIADVKGEMLRRRAPIVGNNRGYGEKVRA